MIELIKFVLLNCLLCYLVTWLQLQGPFQRLNGFSKLALQSQYLRTQIHVTWQNFLISTHLKRFVFPSTVARNLNGTKRPNNARSLCPKPGVHYYLMRARENDTHLNKPCLYGTGLWHCPAGAPGRRCRSAARLHSGLAWVEQRPCCSDISLSCPKVLPLLVDWCPLR